MLRLPFLFVILLGILLLSVLPTNAKQGDNFYSVGWLSAYDVEPSTATMAYRYELGHVEWGYDAYIATADCTYVGWTGTMTYEDGRQYTVQVFDCSGHDVKPGTAVIEAAGFVAELDYASWQAYGLGRVAIELSRPE